jgi:hypothetical protein
VLNNAAIPYITPTSTSATLETGTFSWLPAPRLVILNLLHVFQVSVEINQMKSFKRWLGVPIAMAIALGTASAAFSQAVAITPSSQTIQLSGTSGGGKQDSKGCAGSIATAPNHVIQVTEDANLQFTLQSSGEPALLIRSGSGQAFCVPADSYSNGKITIPGRWNKGTYSVYVGDRANGQHPYTLSISRS